jgi:hypothetical protein
LFVVGLLALVVADPPPTVRGYRATNTAANFTALLGADASATRRGVTYSIPGQSFDEFSSAGGVVNVSGDLNIGGTVAGLGGISAEGMVEFSANPGLNATKNLGVAVRAGSKMTLEPPPKLDRANLLGADGAAFMTAHDGLTRGQQNRLDEEITEGLVDTLSGKSTGLRGTEAANTIIAELTALGYPLGDVDFGKAPLLGWGNRDLNLHEYVRLREYVKASQNPGRAADMLGRDLKAMLRAQLETYRAFAATGQLTLSEFFNTGGEVPDMIFRGLVYSGTGGLSVTGGRNTLLTEGALVSQGNLNISDVPSFVSIYNRDYLDDVGANVAASQYHLETVYFATP